MRPLIPKHQSFHYIVSPGMTIKTVANALHTAGYLKHPEYLVIYSLLRGDAKHIKAGEYEFPAGTTARQLITKLVEGKVIIHDFTIIEGWTLKQILAALAKQPDIIHKINSSNVKQLSQQLHLKKKDPEGLFFPATYYYTYGATDLDLLSLAADLMQQKLATDWQQREKGLLYKSPYQALIVASMIEKETALNSEKSMIAGVILNRIRKNMYLQIDPTVIYALGNNYDGAITLKDLRYKSPYNTYVTKGLPPTPIGAASESSIIAALHPDKTQMLYFVADGKGGHVFSKTLKAHDQAIIKYILNKGKKTSDSFSEILLENAKSYKDYFLQCWYLPANLMILCH